MKRLHLHLNALAGDYHSLAAILRNLADEFSRPSPDANAYCALNNSTGDEYDYDVFEVSSEIVPDVYAAIDALLAERALITVPKTSHEIETPTEEGD